MLYRITISSYCFLTPLIQIWSEISVKQGTVLLLKMATAAAAETGIYISEQLYKGPVNTPAPMKKQISYFIIKPLPLPTMQI